MFFTDAAAGAIHMTTIPMAILTTCTTATPMVTMDTDMSFRLVTGLLSEKTYTVLPAYLVSRLSRQPHISLLFRIPSPIYISNL